MRETEAARRLVIGRPYIVCGAGAGTSRLCSRVTVGEAAHELWFEVEDAYRECLCAERSDAFLVALLPYLMRRGVDVTVEGPVTERLYYKLVHYFIPVWDRDVDGYQSIPITAPLAAEPLETQRGVGTGFSGGIDSLYTIAQHVDVAQPAFGLTHLTFFNVGASGDYGGDHARQLFHERLKFVRPFAQELGLPLVTVDSNISEFIQMDFRPTYACRTIAAVMALQKLFSVYYFSSAYTLAEFDIKRSNISSGFSELFYMHSLETDATTLYVAGLETNRVDKTEIVSRYPPSYRYLNVCTTEDDAKNCGHCDKCRRTLLALYYLEKLDLYAGCFDLDYFEKTKTRMIIYMLGNRNLEFYKEIYDLCKARKIHFSPGHRVAGALYRMVKTVYLPFKQMAFIHRLRDRVMKPKAK